MLKNKGIAIGTTYFVASVVVGAADKNLLAYKYAYFCRVLKHPVRFRRYLYCGVTAYSQSHSHKYVEVNSHRCDKNVSRAEYMNEDDRKFSLSKIHKK